MSDNILINIMFAKEKLFCNFDLQLIITYL